MRHIIKRESFCICSLERRPCTLLPAHYCTPCVLCTIVHHTLCTLLPAAHCTPCDRCYLLSASSVWRKLLSATLSSPQVENGEGLDQEETKVEELRTGDATRDNQHYYISNHTTGARAGSAAPFPEDDQQECGRHCHKHREAAAGKRREQANPPVSQLTTLGRSSVSPVIPVRGGSNPVLPHQVGGPDQSACASPRSLTTDGCTRSGLPSSGHC